MELPTTQRAGLELAVLQTTGADTAQLGAVGRSLTQMVLAIGARARWAILPARLELAARNGVGVDMARGGVRGLFDEYLISVLSVRDNSGD